MISGDELTTLRKQVYRSMIPNEEQFSLVMTRMSREIGERAKH